MKTKTRFKVEYRGLIVADVNTFTRAQKKLNAYLAVCPNRDEVTLTRYVTMSESTGSVCVTQHTSVFAKQFHPTILPERNVTNEHA